MKKIIYWLAAMPAMALVAIVMYLCVGQGILISCVFSIAMCIASFVVESTVSRYVGLVMLGMTLLVAAFSHPIIAGLALLGLAAIAHFGFHAKWLAIPAALAGGLALVLWLMATLANWAFHLPWWAWLLVAVYVADRTLYWFRYRNGPHTLKGDFKKIAKALKGFLHIS